MSLQPAFQVFSGEAQTVTAGTVLAACGSTTARQQVVTTDASLGDCATVVVLNVGGATTVTAPEALCNQVLWLSNPNGENITFARRAATGPNVNGGASASSTNTLLMAVYVTGVNQWFFG